MEGPKQSRNIKVWFSDFELAQVVPRESEVFGHVFLADATGFAHSFDDSPEVAKTPDF